MRVDGNASAGGGLGGRGIPYPTGPVTHRPIERRNTSPFTGTAPAQPDPDAVARLERKRRPTVPRPVRFGRAPIALPAQDIAAAYEAGGSAREIAEQHGVHVNTILRRLHEAGVQLRNHNDRRNPRKDPAA